MAGWPESLLLRNHLNRHIGFTGPPASLALQLWSAVALGAGAAWIIKWAVGPLHPLHTAVILLGPYELVYGAMALAFGVPEARDALGRAKDIMRSRLREVAASFGLAASGKTHGRMEGSRETDEI